MEKKDASMLQEKMALQRTILANHRTVLSFLRTSMYFLVAGLSIKGVLRLEDDHVIHISLYAVSGAIFVLGVIVYFRELKKMRKYKGKIEDFKEEAKALVK